VPDVSTTDGLGSHLPTSKALLVTVQQHIRGATPNTKVRDVRFNPTIPHCSWGGVRKKGMEEKVVDMGSVAESMPPERERSTRVK
jgi:hypothetical protein